MRTRIKKVLTGVKIFGLEFQFEFRMWRGVVSPPEKLFAAAVPDNLPLDHVNDVFGDIGGMVGDSFQDAGNAQ